MQEETQKPQLTNSMLEQMARCGIQFQRRYGARFGCWHSEEIVPPGIALLTGISVHKSVEMNYRHKMAAEGQMIPRAEAEAITRDEFMNLWQAGVMLTEDEADNVKTVLGSSVDMSVRLAALHYDNVAPDVNPVAVEEPFVIEMKNYPYDLAGRKDVRTATGIHDVKTKAASPPANAAQSNQMAMYALSEKVKPAGKLSEYVSLEFLVKTKTPKLVIRQAIPTEDWINPLLKRIEQMMKIIQAVKEGHIGFTPADPEHWCCQKKYCGFATDCDFWSGK